MRMWQGSGDSSDASGWPSPTTRLSARASSAVAWRLDLRRSLATHSAHRARSSGSQRSSSGSTAAGLASEAVSTMVALGSRWVVRGTWVSVRSFVPPASSQQCATTLAASRADAPLLRPKAYSSAEEEAELSGRPVPRKVATSDDLPAARPPAKSTYASFTLLACTSGWDHSAAAPALSSGMASPPPSISSTGSSSSSSPPPPSSPSPPPAAPPCAASAASEAAPPALPGSPAALAWLGSAARFRSA
mmetsp:Transcript_22021/g.83787  ORF Transcript_22021/g.83787 Transcript_22021/m.83787 type:complete len:247 (+) Transcript_22021:705-1445(+)